MLTLPAVPLVSCSLIAPCFAQSPHDKSGYTLLNPTPAELRRPLSADRPDATESPYTVDAGAIQIEMSFVEYAWSGDDGNETSSISAAPINLKIGITNSFDMQLTLNPYERISGADDAEGLGNLGLRAKINVWGNDFGPSALALLPYVVFPTGDDGVSPSDVEGGLVVPFALELAGGWGLGLQGEVGAVSAESGNGHDLLLAHTCVLGHDLAGDLAGYVEYIGEVVFGDDTEYRPSVAGGLTYSFSEDVQLDFGIVIGLDSPDTEDIRCFSGVTLRF